MSDQYLHRVSEQVVEANSLNKIVSPENSSTRAITVEFGSLSAGSTLNLRPVESEQVLILLSGQISADIGDGRMQELGERKSVFAGRASAVYLPPGAQADIEALSGAEVVVASAPSTALHLSPGIVVPEQVKERLVGKDNWFRKVHDVIGPEFAADRLIIGETFNPPGNWSSSPPHKHDQENPPEESEFEEVYFYKLNPACGWGMQRIYSTERDIDCCLTVQENDAVVIPFGYHPVVAAPGYELYYLWVLHGRHRKPVWFEDPRHSWINKD